MSGRPKILVVEDSGTQLKWLVQVLAREKYDISTAGNGEEAIRKLRSDLPDLVLLDMILPDMEGLDVLRIVKTHGEFIPVILLSAKSDLDSRVTGLRIGADDFLAKPFAQAEILARAAAMLRIKSLQDEVRAQKKMLEELSVTDGLTSLANHRYFEETIRKEVARAQRYSDPVSLIMIDLDHFKRVNDSYGHPFGDKVLKESARLIRESLRETDTAARYGGEEFAIILPKTVVTGALAVAERVRRKMNEHVFRGDGPLSPVDGAPAAKSTIAERVTASFGVACYPSHEITTADLLIRYADEALYRAKRERNAICVHESQANGHDVTDR